MEKHSVIASVAWQSIFFRMILSVTLSKPVNNIEESLGKPYLKIKIRAVNTADGASYAAEMFTKTQVFHKKFSDVELDEFLKQNSGITFKNVVTRTDSEEITLLTNKKGKTTELRKKLTASTTAPAPLKILPPKKRITFWQRALQFLFLCCLEL